MTEPLQVGQFAIVDHEPVDRGPNAGVFFGKGPHDDRAELYLIAEGTTPAGDAFAGHVVSTLGQLWATLDMSLTGSLHRLFAEADQNLRDWNDRSIAQHRVSLGLTAFARRGGQSVVAQAGPSVAFHLRGKQVSPIYSDEAHAIPLGVGREAGPALTRIEFGAGDRLLMLTSAALRTMDDDVIGGILKLPAEQVLSNLYRRLEGERSASVLLVSNPPGKPKAADVLSTTDDGEFIIGAPAPLLSDDGAVQANLFGEAADAEAEEASAPVRPQLLKIEPRTAEAYAPVAVAEATAPEPLRRVAGDPTFTERHEAMTARSRELARNSTMPMYTAQPGIMGRASAESGSERRRTSPRSDSFSRGLVRQPVPPRPQPPIGDAPPVDQLAEAQRLRTQAAAPYSNILASDAEASIMGGEPLVRMRGSMGARWRGNSGIGGGRRATVSGAHTPPTWLVVALGVAALLIAVGFMTVPRLLQEASGERYTRLVTSAQQQIATAEVSRQDLAGRRKALTTAQALLLEAREADPSGEQAQTLLTRVVGDLAVLDAVMEPAKVETVASLEQFGTKPVSASRIAVGASQAYLFDQAAAQIIAVTFASGEKAVVFGESAEAKRGRPVAIAYTEAGDAGGPGLLVADSNRTLWSFSPQQGLRQLPFIAPGNMTITDIAIRDRALYVLDASQAAVFKYTPAEGGYATPPVKVLDTPELAAARRLMVDNEIFTADADGTLRRFTGQLSLKLSGAGIDKMLVAPETPQALGDKGEVAVLDAANDRIVVFNRNGDFVRQYRHKDFRSITAFSVLPDGAYIFSGGQLRRVVW